jgi:hypothetical protein
MPRAAATVEATVEPVETAPEPQVTMTLSEVRALLAGVGGGGITADVLAEILAKNAETSAEAMRKSMKPENTFAPMVSVFSYPEGDRAKPRPSLPFELLWSGFPVHKESVSTWYELEQFAQLKPGEYICSKSDLSPIKVTAKAEWSADNSKVSRLSVTFPTDRDLRVTMPSPYVWAYQMNHSDRPARETYVEAMSNLLNIQLNDMRAKQQRLAS